MEFNLAYYDLSIREDADRFVHDEHDILECIRASVPQYYGDIYHRRRILTCRSHVITARHRALNIVCGVTYIKSSGRRALLCVLPEFRNKGLGGALIEESIRYLPRQYSIVHSSNKKILTLLARHGFCPIINDTDAKTIAKHEANMLFNFREVDGVMVFDRRSESRHLVVSSLRMLAIGYDLPSSG